jgi:hypothetical protein
MNTVKAAYKSLVESFKPGGIDKALFTSFNFSSNFFERNVLPMLIDTELSDGAELDALQINDALRKIAVTVICDRSTNPKPKGNLRYGLLPVGLRHGFFHLKLVMLSGILLDGNYGIKLMVGSCNITLSGWGINREVVGITDMGTQQSKALQPLLVWLIRQADNMFSGTEGKEEGDIRVCLSKWHKNLDEIDFLSEDSPDLYVRLPSYENNRYFIDEVFAQKQFEYTHIVSPFWSEYETSQALIKKLGAKNVRLTPSINNKGEWSFPEQFKNEAKERKEQFNFSSFKQRDRYTHAKSIYAWNVAGQAVLVSGSANFTQAAMGSLTQGNVEAVLKYSLKHDDTWKTQFLEETIESINWTEQVDSDEHAPEIMPFDLLAIYDWKGHVLKVRLDCSKDVFKRINSVKFNKSPLDWTLENEVYVASVKTKLRGPCPPLEISYQKDSVTPISFTVLVSQLNAEDDELGYLPKPELSKIIDQLRKLGPESNSGFNLVNSALSESESLDGEKEPEVEYDFFSIFQAIYKLKESYLEGGNKGKSPFDEHAPYSLALIYRALMLDYEETKSVAKGNMDVYFIRYYIFLSELLSCCKQLNHLDTTGDSASIITAMEADIAAVNQQFLTLIASSPVLSQFLPNSAEQPLIAETMASWFTEQLNGQPS